jgi:hypothetical protein
MLSPLEPALSGMLLSFRKIVEALIQETIGTHMSAFRQ